jgi:RIP homotypic interaction motif
MVGSRGKCARGAHALAHPHVLPSEDGTHLWGDAMRRSVILTAVVTSVMSTTLTALVMLALLPAVVSAQVERISTTGLTIVRADGLQGVLADVRPTGGGLLQILGPDGTTPRVQVASGGRTAGQPVAPGPGGAGVNVYNANGVQVGRIGVGASDRPIVQIQLADAQGNVRYRASVDPDGNPTIELLNAEGEVTWSAP